METTDAAIFFVSDGYDVAQKKLMGRQAAGYGFLRAAALAQENRTLWGLCPTRSAAAAFESLTRDILPAISVNTLRVAEVSRLAEPGALYLPGPNLAEHAYLRLRSGIASHSLVGVTHTTCSHGAMDRIIELLDAPIMPWDALICTSTAVRDTVEKLFETQLEYLRWRFGSNLDVTVPKLPVIPLGVHLEDFSFTDAERQAARASLGLAPDDVAALFVGRLSFHAKAHPHAMYVALENAAQKTGKQISLIECGWFANEAIENSFLEGAARACPSVRHMILDGREAARRRTAFAAADVFISFSDNYQETFGLTPIEAMAAGLPAVVSDWNGYRDTVRDGIDGYRVPTAAPAPDTPAKYAFLHETGDLNYDHYIGTSSLAVSVDHGIAAKRLSDLFANPDLRKTMGAAAKKRASSDFDWRKIYSRYRDLYSELREIRESATREQIGKHPVRRPGRLEPFEVFENYPTLRICDRTLIRLVNSLHEWSELRSTSLFEMFGRHLLKENVAEKILACLTTGSKSLAEIAVATSVQPGALRIAIAQLLKANIVAIEN
jgi:glycosyltransferase involved in cell wall biosynthesis